MSQPIRILLADDHTIVRAGIRSLLEKTPDFQIVAEASDGREVVDLARTHVPDVVVMDIGMPGLNGLDATLRVLQDRPPTRVVVLSMHGAEEYVAQAWKAGASAYLLKGSAVTELEAAIRAVMRGQTYLSSSLAARAPSQGDRPPGELGTSWERLTPRQREILQLIAESKNTKEIAHMLGLSAKTIEFHRSELMSRLKIFDVPGLVRYAMQKGLTPTES
jgi:DNA-binding NarL/FixJ family response regulator